MHITAGNQWNTVDFLKSASRSGVSSGGQALSHVSVHYRTLELKQNNESEVGGLPATCVRSPDEAGQNPGIQANRECRRRRRVRCLARQRQCRGASARGPAGLRAGTFYWDLRTNEVDWDEGMVRLFGLAPGKAPARAGEFLQFLHPEDFSPYKLRWPAPSEMAPTSRSSSASSGRTTAFTG